MTILELLQQDGIRAVHASGASIIHPAQNVGAMIVFHVGRIAPTLLAGMAAGVSFAVDASGAAMGSHT